MNLGPRLKALREGKKLSIRGLSRETSLAASFLSALEANKTTVSVARLKNILDVLGTTLGEFFSEEPAPAAKVVYRTAELVEISGQKNGISFKEVAAGRPGRVLQLLLEEYKPGADTGEEMYQHEAQEAGVVLEGELELIIDGQHHRLRPGDAYYFDSRLPHRWRNPGKKTVKAISVNSPPSF